MTKTELNIHHSAAMGIIRDAKENLYEEHRETLSKVMPLLEAAPELLKELERLYFYIEALRQDGKIDIKCAEVTDGTLKKAVIVINKTRTALAKN